MNIIKLKYSCKKLKILDLVNSNIENKMYRIELQ